MLNRNGKNFTSNIIFEGLKVCLNKDLFDEAQILNPFLIL